jgi:hypothetical protein
MIEPTGARPRKPCNCTKSQLLLNPYYAALKLHDMAAAAAFFVCFA